MALIGLHAEHRRRSCRMTDTSRGWDTDLFHDVGSCRVICLIVLRAHSHTGAGLDGETANNGFREAPLDALNRVSRVGAFSASRTALSPKRV